jgi:hypothetical protein
MLAASIGSVNVGRGRSGTMIALMRRPVSLAILLFSFLALPMIVAAQDPPPRMPRVVLDVRGSVPKFTTEQQLADSRGINQVELPGRGWGADAAVHLYVFKWKVMTIGLGGQLTLARAANSPREAAPGVPALAGVTERFTSVTPQLSFNFGDGDGWSYFSGGIGPAQRTLVPVGGEVSEIDEQRLRTINYGGGARWFIKDRLAFTLDVRFHQIDPAPGMFGLVGTPRSTMLIIGAGASFK